MNVTTIKMPCDEKHHFEDYKLGVPKVSISVCTCGRYKLGKRWTDKIGEVYEFVIKRTQSSFTIITEIQYRAWLKKKLGIPLSSTEQIHLQRFNEKKERIKQDYYELQALSILDYPL